MVMEEVHVTPNPEDVSRTGDFHIMRSKLLLCGDISETLKPSRPHTQLLYSLWRQISNKLRRVYLFMLRTSKVQTEMQFRIWEANYLKSVQRLLCSSKL